MLKHRDFLICLNQGWSGTTHFQLLYAIKRLSLVFTPSGTVSFTPRKYKINLIRTLSYRCLRICSKSTLLQSTLPELKNSFLQNGYPRGIINHNVDHILNKHKHRPSEPQRWCLHADQNLVSISFMVLSTSGLFFRTLSEVSLSFLTKLVSTARRNQRLSAKPIAGIHCDAFYIGKTKRGLHDRRRCTSKLLLKLATQAQIQDFEMGGGGEFL